MNKMILHRMNGLGNDFLIFDSCENDNISLTDADILNLSKRSNSQTKGCDQFIVLKEPPSHIGSDIKMDIFNQDGGEVEACGNATRCVIYYLDIIKNIKPNQQEFSINTKAGILNGNIVNFISKHISQISVNMGKPIFEWQNIPLTKDVDIDNLPISFNGVNGIAVSIGNPHLVFFLEEDINSLDLEKIAPKYQKHSLYPQKTNVSFANIIDKKNIKLRVFERGVGETKACGTGACATHVAAHKNGFINSISNIHLTGGSLEIEWHKHSLKSQDSGIIMSGVAEYEERLELPYIN